MGALNKDQMVPVLLRSDDFVTMEREGWHEIDVHNDTCVCQQVVNQVVSVSVDAQSPQGSHLDTLPAVELGADVEIKARLAVCGQVAAGVEVNQVLYLRSATVHHPVVPVEWGLVAKQGVYAGLGREASAVAGKGMESWFCAAILSLATTCRDVYTYTHTYLCIYVCVCLCLCISYQIAKFDRVTYHVPSMYGLSHSTISAHARSLTALWIGTTTRMSASRAS